MNHNKFIPPDQLGKQQTQNLSVPYLQSQPISQPASQSKQHQHSMSMDSSNQQSLHGPTPPNSAHPQQQQTIMPPFPPSITTSANGAAGGISPKWPYESFSSLSHSGSPYNLGGPLNLGGASNLSCNNSFTGLDESTLPLHIQRQIAASKLAQIEELQQRSYQFAMQQQRQTPTSSSTSSISGKSISQQQRALKSTNQSPTIQSQQQLSAPSQPLSSSLMVNQAMQNSRSVLQAHTPQALQSHLNLSTSINSQLTPLSFNKPQDTQQNFNIQKFIIELDSSIKPNGGGPKSVIDINVVSNFIKRGELYQKAEDLVIDILTNETLIPGFSILTYIRRDNLTKWELMKISEVHSRLDLPLIIPGLQNHVFFQQNQTDAQQSIANQLSSLKNNRNILDHLDQQVYQSNSNSDILNGRNGPTSSSTQLQPSHRNDDFSTQLFAKLIQQQQLEANLEANMRKNSNIANIDSNSNSLSFWPNSMDGRLKQDNPTCQTIPQHQHNQNMQHQNIPISSLRNSTMYKTSWSMSDMSNTVKPKVTQPKLPPPPPMNNRLAPILPSTRASQMSLPPATIRTKSSPSSAFIQEPPSASVVSDRQHQAPPTAHQSSNVKTNILNAIHLPRRLPHPNQSRKSSQVTPSRNIEAEFNAHPESSFNQGSSLYNVSQGSSSLSQVSPISKTNTKSSYQNIAKQFNNQGNSSSIQVPHHMSQLMQQASIAPNANAQSSPMIFENNVHNFTSSDKSTNQAINFEINSSVKSSHNYNNNPNKIVDANSQIQPQLSAVSSITNNIQLPHNNINFNNTTPLSTTTTHTNNVPENFKTSNNNVVTSNSTIPTSSLSTVDHSVKNPPNAHQHVYHARSRRDDAPPIVHHHQQPQKILQPHVALANNSADIDGELGRRGSINSSLVAASTDGQTNLPANLNELPADARALDSSTTRASPNLNAANERAKEPVYSYNNSDSVSSVTCSNNGSLVSRPDLGPKSSVTSGSNLNTYDCSSLSTVAIKQENNCIDTIDKRVDIKEELKEHTDNVVSTSITQNQSDTKISENISQAQNPSSKYTKLYTKKAWIQNYDLEDHSNQQPSSTNTSIEPTSINIANLDNTDSSNIDIKNENSDEMTKTRGSSSETSSSAKVSRTNYKSDKDKKINDRRNVDKADNHQSLEVKNEPISDSDTLEGDDDDKKTRRVTRNQSKPRDQNLKSRNKMSRKKLTKEERQTRKRKRLVDDVQDESSKNSGRMLKRAKISRSTTKNNRSVKKVNSINDESQNDIKKNSVAFLQNTPCNDIVPKSNRCLECRHNRNGHIPKDTSNIKNEDGTTNTSIPKENWDDFCRFYEFRKLKFNEQSRVVIAGFLEFDDATETDKSVWQPDAPLSSSIKPETAKFILRHIGDHFCKIVKQEHDAVELYNRINMDSKTIIWKRVGNGVRELCDVCYTTLFDSHFVCETCGFVVCIDCYTYRAENIDKNHNNQENKTHYISNQRQGKRSRHKSTTCDEFGWLQCIKNVQHSHDRLRLAKIIVDDYLNEVWTSMLAIKEKFKIDLVDEAMVDDNTCNNYYENEQQVSQVIDSIIDDVIGFSSKTNGFTVNINLDNNDSKKFSINGNKNPSSIGWMSNGELLVMNYSDHEQYIDIFRKQWIKGRPVIVQGVDASIDLNLWSPQYFSKEFGDYRSDLVDCRNGDIHRQSMKKYWDGFEPLNNKKPKFKDERHYIPSANNEEISIGCPSYYSGSPLWKLKDWPPGQDFVEILPNHFEDYMNNLPLKSYTTRFGELNLVCRLPSGMLRPDLGPKMYSAYGSPSFPERGTTNLHLDISDAINTMIYVSGTAKYRSGENFEEQRKLFDQIIDECHIDQDMKKQLIDKKAIPGALWHVFKTTDCVALREFLNKVSDERKISMDKRCDPIHDQVWYLDQQLLKRLYDEYNVQPYSILQCMGDAIMIPAGAPHQVKNLRACLKVASDFVSPENVDHCLRLTDEFRSLPETHINHEDKLQIKNILYHTVKECIKSLKTE